MTNEESARYGRVCRLVMQSGTTSIRHFVLNNLNPDRRDLDGTLRAQKEKFDKLLRHNIISIDQFKILYPGDEGRARVSEIDLSLWTVLARNVTTLDKKNWRPTCGADEKLDAKQAICSIKEVRNTLFHKPEHRLGQDEFDTMWTHLEIAITRLDGESAPEVKRLKGANLDELATERAIMQLDRQQLAELRASAQRRTGKRIRAASYVILVGIIIVLGVFLVIGQGGGSSCDAHIQYIATNGGLIAYIPRVGWNAEASRAALDRLNTPVQYVIVSHTALLARCTTMDECCGSVAEVQRFNMHTSGFYDVAYNYLVGDNGAVFEGRGGYWESSAAKGWNKDSISIAFHGLYEGRPPFEEALHATQSFLLHLVTNGTLREDYIIYGLCQVRDFPLSPGAALYAEIRRWPHWRNRPNKQYICENAHEIREPRRNQQRNEKRNKTKNETKNETNNETKKKKVPTATLR